MGRPGVAPPPDETVERGRAGKPYHNHHAPKNCSRNEWSGII
jgi:hypothetical protein